MSVYRVHQCDRCGKEERADELDTLLPSWFKGSIIAIPQGHKIADKLWCGYCWSEIQRKLRKE